MSRYNISLKINGSSPHIILSTIPIIIDPGQALTCSD
jgi:hypothetical protein